MESDKQYKSVQIQWDKHASIRSRPRRILRDIKEGEYLFPLSRQPLALHPQVLSKGTKARDFILTQSLYKFLGDIATQETELVNVVSQRIYNDSYPYSFPWDLRVDVLSVIIDEAYHAYVALDFLKQVEEKTGIKPIEFPREFGLQLALKKVKSEMDQKFHDAFEIMAICIAENSITKELIALTKEKGLNETYEQVNADHVIDETRHSKIFAAVLRHLWAQLNEEEKQALGECLPSFVE